MRYWLDVCISKPKIVISTKFGLLIDFELPWCRIVCRLRANGRNRNRKWISNMADVCLKKTEVVIYQRSIEVCRRNLVCWYNYVGLLKARTSTHTKPEAVLSDHGRHLEKSIWRHTPAVAVDPEWHNNGDEVKIENENLNWRLKARNFSLVVQACKPGIYSYVRRCILAGVEQLYTGNIKLW